MKSLYKYAIGVSTSLLGGAGLVIAAQPKNPINVNVLPQQQEIVAQNNQPQARSNSPSSYYAYGSRDVDEIIIDVKQLQRQEYEKKKDKFIVETLNEYMKKDQKWFIDKYLVSDWKEKLAAKYVLTDSIYKDLRLARNTSLSLDERKTYLWSAFKDIIYYGVAQNLPEFLTI